ncbi:unnamed protein product [Tuber melanosporum]|uniref:(Perigord truffle) hypothetical protein n=1 Tax=Tuber melanosporum (strain Mel28) TaxID=656061 RepID=D5GPG2_TUBMM|nr:uncharacterized protein GSTUM_00011832001 [Tuber melanosporum]CAZ86405.1 unnamed protein product [Tuber melanosporum]
MSLDNELLMLAGEEDEDDFKPSSPPRRKRTSSPNSVSPAKKRAKPTVRKTNKKKTRRDSDDKGNEDSSGLSDAPSSSEEGFRSEAEESMDLESSSDEEDSVQDLYPLEGKYKDQADMRALLAMNEIDREALLAERAGLIERAQQDRHLRNLLKSRNTADTANGTSVSGANRRSTRTKSMPKKTEETTKRGKLDELKKIREERITRAAGSGKQTGDEDDARARRRSINEDDEDKAGYNEEIYVKEDDRDIVLADVNKARIGRTGLAKLCDYPGFEEVVTDCFVRVSLFDRETGTTSYRLGWVKGFVSGKYYNMLDGKRRTDQHLRVSQGLAERSFGMEFMSDSPITEAELNRFKKQMEFDHCAMPPLSLLEKKSRELRELDNRVLTQDEVNEMIRKRNSDKVDTVNIVLKRGRLRDARESAQLKGDEAEVARIDKELQDLGDQHGKSLVVPKSQMERLAKLNAVNRKKNVAEIRKAEIEEKRAARTAAVHNPFMRVKTVAKTRHNLDGGKKEGGDSQNASGDSQTDTESKSSPAGVGFLSSSTKGRGRLGASVDDVIANYDFGIEIDI